MRLSQCSFCQHLSPANQTCRAFTAGIPLDILLTKVDHRNPVDGDGGITFLAVEGAVHPLVDAPPDEYE